MPIGGFVVSVLPEEREETVGRLSEFEGVTVYGYDERGNVVVVIEAEDYDAMDSLVERIMGLDGVLNVGLAYLNFEDEIST